MPVVCAERAVKRSGGSDKFSTQLEISNPSEHRIMFRMRTTNPSRYLVTPRTGIIDSVSVVNTTSALLSAPQARAYFTCSLPFVWMRVPWLQLGLELRPPRS